MSLLPGYSRNGDDRPPHTDMSVKSLRYGWVKWFVDRRNAARDGRNGFPAYADQPPATPTTRNLVSEFTELVAAERKHRDTETAPQRRELADLTARIEAAQEVLESEQRRLDGAQQTATDDVTAWRRKRELQGLSGARLRLARQRAMRKELEEEIASRDRQYLNRCNQLAAYTLRRVETYWDKLIQVHPDGPLLNEVINKWGPAQLDGILQGLAELDERLISSDRSRTAIEPGESNRHA